jgi:hypothetical protein
MNEPHKPVSISPGPLRPISLEIPASWTPEQALAVFELLDDLRHKVWTLYGFQIQDVLRDLYGTDCTDAEATGVDPTF